MNKEEKEFFYSIGRGSLNLNGKFYYGLDYSITDFMNSLEQENQKYKEVTDKIKEYIQKIFYFNEETGEYSLLHTFDKCNAKELLDILNEVSE